jgi:hypothetical protein
VEGDRRAAWPTLRWCCGQAVACERDDPGEFLQRIDGGPGYHIRKLRFEALPGLWIPALLYEPDRLDGRVPVVLNVNGHDAKGKAVDYKQLRCINQAKRGMIALNLEWFGMGQLGTPGFAHGVINAVDLCGTSGSPRTSSPWKRGSISSSTSMPTRAGWRDGLSAAAGRPSSSARSTPRHVNQPRGRLLQLPIPG